MDYVWIKNKLVHINESSIDFYDRGYHFGDGIYEVIRIYDGTPFLLKEHYHRFVRSAKELDMPFPLSISELNEITETLIKKNELGNGYIYFQLTRGEQERNHLYTRDLTPVLTAFVQELHNPIKEQNEGVVLWALEDIRWLRCDIKTVNLLGNIMAKRKAADHNCDEALQHRGEIVTEGSASNIFLFKDDVLLTHPANHFILNGITRELVIKLARSEQWKVEEKAFTLTDIKKADEMFITSTTLEIVPVIQIKGTLDISLERGDTTKKLQEAFQQEVHK